MRAKEETFARAAAEVAKGTDPLVAAAAVVGAMTREEKLWCLDGDVPCWAGLGDLAVGGYHRRPFPAAVVERLGVPGFAFSDGPRGVVIGPATCFPVSMARGATWDVDLEERIGDAIGRELRAVGADLYGGVCVNVLRHPAWGRAQETYGEDPLHVGELGAALTRGVQRHTMACVKHLACNSMENARFQVDVTVDDVALHEVFLPHFRRIVDEGVAAVMSAYNSVNGSWCGQNRALLTDVLRGEWGFEGYVISDWIFGLRDAGPSLHAGLDVEMPYRMVRAGLPAALEAGEATWAEVERAATSVVATLLRFHAVLARPRPGWDVLACPEHRALAREAAAKAVVVLRNEPVAGGSSGRAPLLPLDGAALRTVAVIGRLGAVRNLGDGGSSDVYAPAAVTVLDGLQGALGGASVVHHDGDDPDDAAELAAASDVAVVVVGYTRADEGEFFGGDATAHLATLFPGPDDPDRAARFAAAVDADPGPEPPPGVVGDDALGFTTGGDRASLRLHPEHEALVTAVAAANARTVVVVVAGSAVVMSAWCDAVPAVVQSWYGGMEAGHGLADVLLGRVDATGRLPFSVPADESHLPPFDRDAHRVVYDRWHGWWLLERDARSAAFPFGFGLSYTSFALGPCWAALEAGAGPGDGPSIVVRGSLRNTGDRAGTDVVQVYGGPAAPDPGRPRRRLLGFSRIEVSAGAEAPLQLRIPMSRLATRHADRRAWNVAPGSYLLDVARHAADPGARRVEVTVPGGRLTAPP